MCTVIQVSDDSTRFTFTFNRLYDQYMCRIVLDLEAQITLMFHYFPHSSPSCVTGAAQHLLLTPPPLMMSICAAALA